MTNKLSRRTALAGDVAKRQSSEPEPRQVGAEAAARLLRTLTILRTSAGSAAPPIDDKAAARALDYFLDMAAGKPEDDDHLSEALAFLKSINVSYDWILDGDVDMLVIDSVMYRRERDAIRH